MKGSSLNKIKALKDKCAELKRHLHEIESITKIGHWEMDVKTGKAKWSRGTYKIVEIKEGDPVPGLKEHVSYYLPKYRPMIKKAMDDVIKKNKKLEFEAQLRTAKGKLKWCKAVGRSHRKSGKCIKIYGTFQDITERKRAQQELEKERNKLREYLEVADVMLTVLDTKGKVVEINNKGAHILGASKKSILGKNWFRSGFLRSKDVPEVKEVFNTLISGEKEKYSYYRQPIVRKNDGAIRLIEWHNSVLKDLDGNVTGTISSGQDITDSQRAHRDRESIFEMASEMMCISDLDPPKFRRINPAFKRILGYDEKELTSRSFLDFVHPDDVEQTKDIVNNQLLMGMDVLVFTNRYRTKEGNYRWIQWNSHPVAEEKITYAIGHDITDLKELNNELSNSQRRLSCHLNNTPIAAIEWDMDFRVVGWNAAAEKIFGFKKEEMLGKRPEKTILPEVTRKEINKVWESLMKDSGGTKSVNENVTKDGRKIVCEWHNTALKDKSGKVIGAASLALDITEKVNSEIALRESEAKYKQIFEGSRDGFVMVAPDQRIIDANEAFCRMTGYELEELRELKSFYDITPEKWHEWEQEKIWERSLLVRGYSEVYEKEYIKKDGTILPVELQSYCVKDNNGKVQYFWGVVRDMSETKKLRDLTSRAERLEAAGTVAGQVAHDFNNLLGPIVAYPEMIKAELPKGHKCIEYIKDIESTAKKMADINQDLLTLGRRGYFKKEVINLNDIIERSINEIKYRSPNIVFNVDKSKDLMNINAGPSQISRMLYNLVSNSLDALNWVGEIFIKTENYYADDVSIAYQIIPKGEYVKLTVSDNGTGIDPEITNKIFEPFFTTKTTEKQRGSGLGMSIVDAVMKDHDGYIDYRTRLGEGTSFYLYFPVSRDPAEKAKKEKVKLKGNEKLMVVDDDTMQREVIKNLLKPLGYRVTVIDSGEKALEKLKRDPQDLLILDMIMPGGIDGTETYKRVLEINPAQRAIIVSGFSETSRVKEAVKLGASSFIRKPLTKTALCLAIRGVLDKK